MLDEFTVRRIGRLRKMSEVVMNRVSKPFLTEAEYINIQAHIMSDIKSQKGKVDFIVNITEATRKSIVNELIRNGQHEAARIASETKITPWL